MNGGQIKMVALSSAVEKQTYRSFNCQSVSKYCQLLKVATFHFPYFSYKCWHFCIKLIKKGNKWKNELKNEKNGYISCKKKYAYYST